MRKGSADSPLITSAIWSDEAERAIIALMLTTPSTIATCIEAGVEPSDFYIPSRSEIVRAIYERYEDGGDIDWVVIADMLRGKVESQLIAEYCDVDAVTSMLPEYISILKRDRLRRKVASFGQEIMVAAQEETDTDLLLAQVDNGLADLSGGQHQRDYAAVFEVVAEEVSSIESHWQHGGRRLGLQTNMALDDIVQALEPGQMVVLAARPGVGKTALALNIAINCGAPTYIVSLEMTRREVAQRMLANIADVELTKIRAARISPDELDRIKDAVERMKKMEVYVDDDAAVTMTELVSRLRRFSMKRGLGLVIIDYLQLMRSGRRSESRQYEVAEMSRRCKLMARELGCPVLVVSQLSRLAKGEAPRPPRLSDLRDSGAIEQDADIVVFLHRRENDVGSVKVIVAKNRQGAIGDVSIGWLPAKMRFDTLGASSVVESDEPDDDSDMASGLFS